MADNKQELICPACGCIMEKVFLKEQNCYVDICLKGCGGIYFDNREFEKTDEIKENADEIFSAYQDRKYTPVNTDKERTCPVCSSVMVKNPTAAGNIEIDTCYSCGGKFLDYVELNKIRESIRQDNSDLNEIVESMIAIDPVIQKYNYNKARNNQRNSAILHIFNKIYQK